MSYSVTVRLPKALGRQLDELAGGNKSEFVRTAIVERLRRGAVPSGDDWRALEGSVRLRNRDYTNAGVRRLFTAISRARQGGP